ncbi:MAG: hypothetical protein ABI347_00155 [Nitrososphaera sp.]|jgi:hypothetical protein
MIGTYDVVKGMIFSRRDVPLSYDEEIKWQRLLMLAAAISAITTVIFDVAVILYLFSDASLPADMDPGTRFMANMLAASFVFVVLPSLSIAPAAIIGGSLFLLGGLKFGARLLLIGLALQLGIGVLFFVGDPFMPIFVTLPIILTSGLLLSIVMKARAYL